MREDYREPRNSSARSFFWYNRRMFSCDSPLLRAFPPPRFLVAPATGLHISSRALRHVAFTVSGAHLKLAYAEEAPLPDGVFKDGELLQRDALKTALLALKEKGRVRSVHASLPEQQAFIFPLHIPPTPPSQIRAVLMKEIAERVPFPADDIVFDYEYAPRTPETPVGALSVSIAVIPKTVVSAYSTLFRECGVELQSLEFGAHALLRALLPKEDMGSSILVSIDSGETSIALVKDHLVRFTATVNVGGMMLSEALVKKLGISYGDANALKKRSGIQQNTEGIPMAEILLPPLSALRDEIKRYYIDWHTTMEETDRGQEQAEKIILCGEEASVPGLVDYVRGSLKEDVVLGNPWQNVHPLTNYTPDLPRTEALAYATAFGLALRSFSC